MSLDTSLLLIQETIVFKFSILMEGKEIFQLVSDRIFKFFSLAF